MKLLKQISIFSLIIASIIISSCKNAIDDGMYVSAKNTMVRSFSLQEDASVLSNLDSIFFTIDLANSLIYNADSLPKGTDVSSIKIKATFSNASDVYVSYENEDDKSITFNYLLSSSDTIDFRKSDEGKVKMKVVATDRMSAQTYTLKVNVHKVEADSLYWKKIETTTIGSELANTVSSKTIFVENGYYLFAQDANDNLTIYRTTDLSNWEKGSSMAMPKMDWRSLIYSGTKLYVVSDDNKLYESADISNISFTQTPLLSTYNVESIVGVYPEDDKLLLITDDNGIYKHAVVDVDKETLQFTEVNSDFPVRGFTQPIIFSSKWTSPQLVIACGEKSNGTLSNAVWGFDGKNWAILNNAISGGTLITPRKGAVMFTYYTYEYNSQLDLHTKVLTYFIIGGWDGTEMTNDLYYTTNLGGKWKKADATSPMAMPSEISPRMYADAFVVEEDITLQSQSNIWNTVELCNTENLSKRYNLKTSDTQKAPYIYMVGGSSEESQYKFINEVWKGVVWRLTFPPIP